MMSHKPNVNLVSKAHLDSREQEVELEAINNPCEEQQDFNKGLKENIDSFSHMKLPMTPRTAATVRMANCSCRVEGSNILHCANGVSKGRHPKGLGGPPVDRD
ncbi:hypothetical protein TNCV_514051 [Trichonephila clavipes]|nr:hypothetical protein TNCV_514051 [Trichonephila clavipes]